MEDLGRPLKETLEKLDGNGPEAQNLLENFLDERQSCKGSANFFTFIYFRET